MKLLGRHSIRWTAQRAVIGVVLGLGVAFTTPAHADGTSDRLVAILLRALPYDHALKERCGDAIDVAVVARAGADTTRAGQAVAAALRALSDTKVSGLPVRVVELPLDDATSAALREKHADTLFLVDPTAADLAKLAEVIKSQKILTLASSRAAVDAGVALGVEVVGDKATLLVNVPAAEGAGVHFAAGLLRVAQIVKPGAP